MKQALVLVLALVLTAGLFAGASTVNANYVAPAMQGGDCCPSVDAAAKAAPASDSCCPSTGMTASTPDHCGTEDAKPISADAGSCPATKACPSTESKSAHGSI